MNTPIDTDFQEWYDNLGLLIPHGHVAQMKMAWNAALENAAKLCDAYVGGVCEDEGNGGVSHDAAARSLAAQIRSVIERGV